jgi:hypothetical protein
MSSCMSTSAALVKHSSHLILGAIAPGAAVGAAKVCYDGIQQAREIENNDTLKSDIKDEYSLASSIVNVGAIAGSAINVAYAFYYHWSILTRGQRALVVFLAVAGTAESVYSVSRFGVEQNTLAAGLFAGAGSFTLNTAGYAATVFRQKHTEEMRGRYRNVP